MKILLVLNGVDQQGAGVVMNLSKEVKSEVISLLEEDKSIEALSILRNSEPEEFIPSGMRLNEPHLTVFAENL